MELNQDEFDLFIKIKGNISGVPPIMEPLHMYAVTSTCVRYNNAAICLDTFSTHK